MNLFGARLGRIGPEDKNLNQLIFDIAEHQRARDIEEIYKRLRHLDLFAPILGANFELEDGRKTLIEKGMDLRTPTTQIQGMAFAVFLVNKTDPRLGDNFIGMNAAEVFDMVEKTNHLAGFAFYNDRESFFGIARQDFPMLRNRYLP